MPLSSAKWIAQRKLQLTEIPSTEMKLPNLNEIHSSSVAKFFIRGVAHNFCNRRTWTHDITPRRLYKMATASTIDPIIWTLETSLTLKSQDV
jgi:hypothetical protein